MIVSVKKRWGILVLLGLMAVAAVSLMQSKEREPEYQGRTLTEWAAIYKRETGLDLLRPRNLVKRREGPIQLSSEAQEASEAIHQMGVNALPWILKWISYEPSGWKMRVNERVERFTSDGDTEGWVLFAQIGRNEQDRIEAAMTALKILGPEAAPAIPELVRLGLATNLATHRAFLGLAYLGKESIAPLLTMMTNAGAGNGREAGMYLGVAFRMDTNALPAVPVLLGCLTNKDPSMVQAAVATLGNLALEPELVVPALTNYLSSPDTRLRQIAARALLRFGKGARPALPQLVQMRDEGDFFLRGAVAKWVREFGPDPKE